MKKILSTQCKNKVHTSCDGYLEYFPHFKGYKCDCECHSVKKVKPTPPVNESIKEKFFADLAYNEWIIDDPYKPDRVDMPISELEKRINILLSTARQEATLAERERIRHDLLEDDEFYAVSLEEYFDSLTSKGGI